MDYMQHRSIIALTFQMCPPSLQWITHPPLLLRLECPCSKSPVYKGPKCNIHFFIENDLPHPPFGPLSLTRCVSHSPTLIVETTMLSDCKSQRFQLGKCFAAWQKAKDSLKRYIFSKIYPAIYGKDLFRVQCKRQTERRYGKGEKLTLLFVCLNPPS